MQRILIIYSKGDEVKFISHSELIRAIEKAVRRAGIPIAYSQGYNPHMKIDFGIPLQFGVTGDNEMLELYMESHSSPAEIMEKLNGALPPGIKISSARTVAIVEPSIQARVKTSLYQFEFSGGDGLAGRVKDILGSKEIRIMRTTKSGTKEVDIRPLIFDARVTGNIVEARLASSQESTIKTSEFSSLFEDAEVNSIKRLGLIA